MAVSHLAFDFRTRNTSRHGVDDQYVNAAAADKRFRDVEGVFAAVRLGDDQIVRIDADEFGVFRIKCVLRVDEGATTACLLGICDDVEADSRLAG